MSGYDMDRQAEHYVNEIVKLRDALAACKRKSEERRAMLQRVMNAIAIPNEFLRPEILKALEDE
jgi:hypothetical protein